MCIIPQEFRGVATVGSGFVCASVPSFDPHETLNAAEFLSAILCSMLVGWACDYDMEHGIYGGNVLGLWCPTTRDRITKLVFDRHRPWIDKEAHWRVHMTINLYFLGGVRHFSSVRRTLGYPLSNSTTTATTQDTSKIDCNQFVALLCTLGFSEAEAKSVDAGPVTIPRPCENCYSIALMTELVAVTTGIPRVCSGLGEQGLLAAACVDLMGLRLFPAMLCYIGGGCECVVRVIAACAVDGFTCCGLETPSKLMDMNAEMQKRWTPSLEQGIRDKAAELGYPVNEYTARKYEVLLTEIDAPCCT